MTDRRVMRWEKITGPVDYAAVVLATGFGAGLAPVAPGTFGTLVGIPIAYFSAGLPIALRVTLWAALFVAGVWGAKHLDETMGSHDNQNIVMDEVVGYGITAWTAGDRLELLLLAFFVFRVFDIIKLPPVRQVDRWSKKGSAWLGGFGVMADDLLAGLQGLLVLALLQYYGLLPPGGL